MFTSKGLNKKINRIHEKSLRLVLNDYQSTLDEMLDTLNENEIRKLRKFLNGYSPDIMNDVFASEAEYLPPPKLPCFCY